MAANKEVPAATDRMQSVRMRSGDGRPVPGTGKVRRGGKHGTGGRTNKT